MTTSYGLTTWTQPVPTGGGPVSILVAGMRGNTPYHMRAVVQFADGSQYLDPDITFTTKSLPSAQLPQVAATTTAGMTPQSGRYLFICLYVWLEKYFSRGDYKRVLDTTPEDSNIPVAHKPATGATRAVHS
jgi:hypothetical protein